MTNKEKFELIDISKLPSEQKSIVEKTRTATNNFTVTDERINTAIGKGLDTIIAKLREKNPEALKDFKAPEPTPPTPSPEPKQPKAKNASVKKTATKKAKVVSTTPEPSKPKNGLMIKAKEIRKEGETWEQAVKRASEILKGDKTKANEVVKTEMQKLLALVRRRKELKGITGTNIPRDAKRTALPRGKRISKDGNTYYESRDNRTDRLAPNYPKNLPLLADGGLVISNDTDLEEVAKYMTTAVKKHKWDLKDLIYYFEKDNNFDYKYRVKIWDEMDGYEMPKTYVNIHEMLRRIVEANEVKMADGGEVDGNFYLEYFVNGKQRGTSLNMNFAEAIALAKKKIKTKSEIIGENDKPLPFSAINVVNDKTSRIVFRIDEFINQKGKYYEDGGSILMNSMYKKGGLLSPIERYKEELKGLTGLSKTAINDFIVDYNITESELLNIVIGLGRKQISRADVVTAIIGDKGNSYMADVLAFAKSNTALKAEEGIDLTDDNRLRVQPPAMPKRKLSKQELADKFNAGAFEFMTNDDEDDVAKAELGANLAGWNGTRFGIGTPQTDLDGFTGTDYSGLVGETGAMSSGELFENGGGINQTPEEIKSRLIEIRQSIHDENISYGEIAELQSYKEYIEPSDVELLQWAGVEEFEEDDDNYAKGGKITKTPAKIKKRLEEIRQSIHDENISYGEIAELQSYKEYIDPSDVELLEWAGVEEFEEDDDNYAKGGFTEDVKFQVGDIVWEKAHKGYGIVMDIYDDAKNGSYGEIRLDSNGNQSIFTFDKDWKTNGYNLIKLGQKGDAGKFTAEVLADMKASAKRLIASRKESKDKEGVAYYQEVYKRLLDGEFDGMVGAVTSHKKVSSVATYVPNRDIKELSVVVKGELKKITGADIIDGVYVKNSASSESKIDAQKVFDKILKDAKEAKQGKSKRFEASDLAKLTFDMVEKLVKAGYTEQQIRNIIFGYAFDNEIIAENEVEYDNGIFSYEKEYISKKIDALVEAKKNNEFTLGIEYPDFDWQGIIKKYKITAKPKEIVLKRDLASMGSYEYFYEVFIGENLVLGHNYGYKSFDEKGKLKDNYVDIGKKVNDPTIQNDWQKEREQKAGFNGGYWYVVSSKIEIIDEVLKTLLAQKSGYCKEINFYDDSFPKNLKENKISFAKGGSVNEMKIKDWYIKNYPTDDLGEEISDASFEDLWNALHQKEDVYDIIGVGDSLVRERLFEHLSEIKGVEYNDIYNKWLEADEYAKGGSIPNNYEGNTAEEVWEKWSARQRLHFLEDHFLSNSEYKQSDINQIYEAKYYDWNDLPHLAQQEIKRHVSKGQYKSGGDIETIPSIQSTKHKND